MDTIDRKILDYVQQRGRDTYAEIGAAVGPERLGWTSRGRPGPGWARSVGAVVDGRGMAPSVGHRRRRRSPVSRVTQP